MSTRRLPEAIEAKLDKLAQATHRSRSLLAEKAIAYHLDFPLLIPYRVRERQVDILRVLHASRKWPQGVETP